MRDILFLAGSLILAVTAYVFSMKRSIFYIHMLQLNGYDNEEYKNWLRENKDKTNRLINKVAEEKTPLVWTDRAKRLYKVHDKVNIAFYIVILVASNLLFNLDFNLRRFALFFLIVMFSVFALQDRILMLSNKLALPKELQINKGFYDAAQKKISDLRQTGLKVVGITGSFGKTSTKFILETILNRNFKVMATPSSFNTPMGLSKVINNELSEEYEVFIAELGAKVPGEIKEVAELVSPDIGIITAVGPTHMHLFKTIDNIVKTKYELIESLEDDGVAIFNIDNEYVQAMSQRTNLKKLEYSIEHSADVWADEIEVSERGLSFVLHIKGDCERTQTRLLGRHNISNILAACSCAYELGMSVKEISERIKYLEPVEHRLQLIDTNPNMVIIDDAFNSNPIGFRAALDVLDGFKNSRKIIITPGMVELGDMEVEENRAIGREMAGVVDIAVLVGIKRTEPIYQGLIEAGFDENSIKRVKSLSEASEFLAAAGRRGDVVLFENDLPDSYSEE